MLSALQPDHQKGRQYGVQEGTRVQSEGQGSLCLALLTSCDTGARLCIADLCGPVRTAEVLGNLVPHHCTGDMNKGVMPRTLYVAGTHDRQLIAKVDSILPLRLCAYTCVRTDAVRTRSLAHVQSQSPMQRASGLQAPQWLRPALEA